MSRVLGVVLLVIALLGVGGTAHAAQWTGDDAVGDAEAWHVDFTDACVAITATTAAAGEDLTGLTVRHQRETLTIGLRYAAPTEAADRGFTFHVLTPRRAWMVDVGSWGRPARWHVTTSAEPRYWSADVDSDGDGDTDCTEWYSMTTVVPCRRAEVGVADTRVAVTLPRSCLGSPTWVQVGAESVAYFEGESETTFVMAGDTFGIDGGTTSPDVHVYGPRVALGHSRPTAASSASRSSVVERRIVGTPGGPWALLPSS